MASALGTDVRGCTRPLVVLALWLAAVPACAAKLKCAPLSGFAAAMTERVIANGDRSVLGEAPAMLSGGLNAVIRMAFEEDNRIGSHTFEVQVMPDGSARGFKPVGFMYTRMILADNGKERRMYRADLKGRVQEAIFFYDRFQGNRESMGTEDVRIGVHDPRVTAGFPSDMKKFCAFINGGALSLQEQLRALEAEKKRRGL